MKTSVSFLGHVPGKSTPKNLISRFALSQRWHRLCALFNAGDLYPMYKRRQCMMNNKMALSALFCAGVMVSGCGMWSDRDSGRSGQSSNRSSASTAQGASKTQAAGAQSRTQIAEVQQALKAKGFDPGTTDGTMGAQTQEALRKFQKANGLPVTGNIDSQTAKALGVSTSAGATGSSSGSSTSGASSSREGAGSSSGSG